MKISKKEYKEIIHEVAERLRDIVYINAERTIRRYLPKRTLEYQIDEDQEFEIIYSFTLLINDFRQILGRLRRRK